MTCGACKHFLPSPYHPMLGACAKGEPSGCAAGFWKTDRRWCPVFEALE